LDSGSPRAGLEPSGQAARTIAPQRNRKGAAPMQIITLGSYPIEQECDLEGRERRGGAWFAARTYPTRLLTLSGAFDMRPAIVPLQRDRRDLPARARLLTPLPTAIDDLLRGVPGAAPAGVVQQLSSAARQELLALVAPAPPLQLLLLDPAH